VQSSRTRREHAHPLLLSMYTVLASHLYAGRSYQKNQTCFTLDEYATSSHMFLGTHYHTPPINFVFEDTSILSVLYTVCFGSHNTDRTVNIRHILLYSFKSWARVSLGSVASSIGALTTGECRAVAEW
jgi:hypothetical protein